MADKQAQVLESQLEYLSLSKPRRILYKFTHFFTSIPKKIKRAFKIIQIGILPNNYNFVLF